MYVCMNHENHFLKKMLQQNNYVNLNKTTICHLLEYHIRISKRVCNIKNTIMKVEVGGDVMHGS